MYLFTENEKLVVAEVKKITASIVDTEDSDFESGNFDADHWTATWLETPCPALGGKWPSEYVNSPTGIEIVLKIIRRMDTGAYA